MNNLPNLPAWLPEAFVSALILLFGIGLALQALAR